jgi:hypothetical protein
LDGLDRVLDLDLGDLDDQQLDEQELTPLLPESGRAVRGASRLQSSRHHLVSHTESSCPYF